MDLSIVTTMYCSAPYLEEFYERIVAEAERITGNFEIIFVNDGSPDNSIEIALSFCKKDNHVKVIDLSRNFGHHKAIMTGLAHAKGALIFLLDCDLEEEPELLGKFYTYLKANEADTVYGVQQQRKGGLFERFTGKVFWMLFNLISAYPLVPNQLCARLMTRQYVASLVKHEDQEIFFPGLCALTGFKQLSLSVHKFSKGRSTYTLGKKIAQFVDSITSFSNKPLVLIFYLGCLIMLVSGIAAIYLILQRVFFSVYLEGWPSLIVSLWLLGGISICCIGIIGVYISKIFMEIKPRPFTIIKGIYEQQSRLDPAD